MRQHRHPAARAITSLILLTALHAAAGSLLTIRAVEGIDPNLDLQLEQKFESMLAKDAAALEPDQRQLTSKKYTPDGDGYLVYAIVDTAGPEVLKTERYGIELRSVGGKKWSVAGRTLEESAERLFRESVQARQFFNFDSLNLDHEGLRIAASRGSVVAYELKDRVTRIVLVADELSYAYEPPEELGTRVQLYQAMKNSWKDELVFTPDLVQIRCDPASCDEVLSRFAGLTKIEPGSLQQTLARYHKDEADGTTKERNQDPFSDFRLPYRDDTRFLEIAVRKAGKDQWIALKLDSDAGHEVEFRADEIGTIYGYPSASTRDRVDPIDIERRDDKEGSLYQVTGLEGVVEVGVLEPELLTADIFFELEAKRDLDAVPFSIQSLVRGAAAEPKAMFDVNELKDGQGRALSWVRLGDSEGVVLLPETIRAGSKFVVHMEFQTKGSVIKVNTSYSYVARSGWLPFVRYTDQIERFELEIRAPSRYVTIGVGTQVSQETQGKVNVTRWKGHSPIHFPTIVFGSYQHDAPKTKAEKSDGTAIPVNVYVDRTAMGDWGIRPLQLRAPGTIAVNALNFYRQLFGVDYPYGKLDLVNDPTEELGAQAPASIVYLGSAIFRSQATLSTAYARDTTTLVEERIAHEVAHQWWGSLVGNANQRSYWFVESLAEYSSALFMEVIASEGYRKPEQGRKAYLSMVGRWADETLSSGLFCSVQDATTLWSNAGYQAAVYSRGPYAFHMLRETFGDEKFFAFLKALATELGGREIVSRDIQMVAERAFGGVGEDGRSYTVDLEWFFDQWIRGVGVPEYTFEYSQRRTENESFVVEGRILQRVFAGKHAVELDGVFYRGVVPLTVLGKDKQQYRTRLIVESAETPFSTGVPAKPLTVTLNQNGSILARPIKTP